MKLKHLYEANKPVDESLIPNGSNDLASLAHFFQAIAYENSFPIGEDVYGPNPANLREHLRVLYGKVDDDGYAVVPRQEYLQQIVTDDGGTFLALDFVADLFMEMLDYHKKLSMASRIEPDKSVYANLKPAVAWQDPSSSYKEYTKVLLDNFVEYASNGSRQRGIKDYDSFEQTFVGYLENISAFFPVTKTEYILSTLSSRMSTGMAIDVVDADITDDREKYLGFIRDTNFADMRSIANRFGFRMDMNAPWRFHCDLDSPMVQHRLHLRGIDSLDMMFDRFYERVHVGQPESLRVLAYEAYDSFVAKYPSYDVLELSSCSGSPKTKVYQREVVSLQELDTRRDNSHWVNMYAFLRITERNTPMTQSEFKHHVKASLDLQKIRSDKHGMNYLEFPFLDRTGELFHKKSLTSEKSSDNIVTNASTKTKIKFY